MKNLLNVCLLGGGLIFGASAQTAPADGVKRVFIENSDSWEANGARGGARNQTPELIKTFSKQCGEVVITNNKAKAGYVVTFSHEGGKGWAQKDNKIAVFNGDGDMIYSDSARSLGSAVKGACAAIMQKR